MMLEQIEKRQREMLEEFEKKQKPKTIGVPTPPDLYEKLVRLKEKEGLSSLKKAMILAACKGVDQLL